MIIEVAKLKQLAPDLYEQIHNDLKDEDYDSSNVDNLVVEIDEVPIDSNGDGDKDLTISDTDSNSSPDTAEINADSKAEAKSALKTAKKALSSNVSLPDYATDDDLTTTGKSKKELDDDANLSVDNTVSDTRQKNILAALLEHRL